ncbi:MAG: DNA-protecting protein DprA [Methanomicrobia archaeon]|nr:DNA-protecting protein DprA [Methanomicrobia archaeon]
METGDYPNWITMAHLPNWKTASIYGLLVDIGYNHYISFEEFFSRDIATLKEDFALSSKESEDILRAREDLQNNSFLAEELISERVELVPFDSPEYPITLKNNLGTKYAPPLLYAKGNTKLFFENKAAIVGSRNVSDKGAEFTKRIARKCASEDKVVVSGYAKGVDRIALETAIENSGMGIVILPQGIMTFKSGFKKLYKYIIEGRVLVVSTYPPKAGWSVGLAMGRNVYLYGLAEEIYVAESDNKGGTWNGAIDGLGKRRKILVRKATPEEKCANNELIARGAIAVDDFGNIAKESRIYKGEYTENIA